MSKFRDKAEKLRQEKLDETRIKTIAVILERMELLNADLETLEKEKISTPILRKVFQTYGTYGLRTVSSF